MFVNSQPKPIRASAIRLVVKPGALHTSSFSAVVPEIGRAQLNFFAPKRLAQAEIDWVLVLAEQPFVGCLLQFLHQFVMVDVIRPIASAYFAIRIGRIKINEIIAAQIGDYLLPIEGSYLGLREGHDGMGHSQPCFVGRPGDAAFVLTLALVVKPAIEREIRPQ